MFDKDGKLIRVVVSEHDITEIDSLHRELEEQEAIKDRYRDQMLERHLEEVESKRVIAKSPCMRKALRQALKVSAVDSTVLLEGESGVGKGLIADLIHKYSSRSEKPLVKINCGAIPESLIESELFGHEKGAFTGAAGKRIGKFEAADKGTLFLDEIGDMAPETQAKVLRVIEDKTFQRRTVSGLPVWERSRASTGATPLQPDFAVARVGPATLAVGSPNEVNELMLVRLGMKPDLKITGQLFDRFQALDRESPLRLISHNPPDLAAIFGPVFARELLDASQLFGLAMTLQNPVKARLLLKTNPANVTELVRNLHDNPQAWLRLADSELLLYSQPPEIVKQDASNLELHFNVPESSARLLLARLAKIDGGAAPSTR